MKNVLVLGLVCLLAGCSSSGGDDGQGGGQAITGAGGAQPSPKPAAGSAAPASTPAAGATKAPVILCTLSVGGGKTTANLTADANGDLTASASAADDDGTARKWDVFISAGKDVGQSETFQIDLENDNGPVARTQASNLGLGPNFPVELLQFFNHSREDEVDVACTLNGE